MADEIWTIQAALEWTVGYLERKGDETPRLSAQWLLAEATGLRRIEVYTHFEQPLSAEERRVLRGFVARRGVGEPLQYITGEVGFRHIALKVRAGVLIPRPETEVLVSEALALLPAAPRPRVAEKRDSESQMPDVSGGVCGEFSVSALHQGEGSLSTNTLNQDASTLQKSDSESQDAPVFLVADLCTGSGCIACSIAYEHPLTQVIATDISSLAVELARQNVQTLGLAERVEVLECDLGKGIPEEMWGNLDLIVSNPPYVPTKVLADIPGEVADFEPVLALDGGEDGLDIFRRMLPFCWKALKAGGACAFELHETCLDNASRLATQAGFVGVRVVNDLAGRSRVLVGRKQGENGDTSVDS